jgi:hypothetical protein
LAQAVDELQAAGLAALKPELAAGLLAFDAATPDAGLVAIVDPEIESAALVFVEAGRSLESGTVLCGIGAAPELSH